MNKKLIRVEGNYFVAGFVIEYKNNQWRINECAPILYWIKKHPLRNLKEVFKKYNFNYQIIDIEDEETT